MHAFAASLAPASDGLGVWYLFGDETTHNEGPNMQQIPKPEQDLFLRLCQTMSRGLLPAHARGRHQRAPLGAEHGRPSSPGRTVLSALADEHPVRACSAEFNLDELPAGAPPRLGAAAGDESYAEAAQALIQASRVVVRVGGGARDAGPEIAALLDLVDGVAVTSPLATGVIPYQ